MIYILSAIQNFFKNFHSFKILSFLIKIFHWLHFRDRYHTDQSMFSFTFCKMPDCFLVQIYIRKTTVFIFQQCIFSICNNLFLFLIMLASRQGCSFYSFFQQLHTHYVLLNFFYCHLRPCSKPTVFLIRVKSLYLICLKSSRFLGR